MRKVIGIIYDNVLKLHAFILDALAAQPAVTHNMDISLPYKMNMLANSCLFIHSAAPIAIFASGHLANVSLIFTLFFF